MFPSVVLLSYELSVIRIRMLQIVLNTAFNRGSLGSTEYCHISCSECVCVL